MRVTHRWPLLAARGHFLFGLLKATLRFPSVTDPESCAVWVTRVWCVVCVCGGGGEKEMGLHTQHCGSILCLESLKLGITPTAQWPWGIGDPLRGQFRAAKKVKEGV